MPLGKYEDCLRDLETIWYSTTTNSRGWTVGWAENSFSNATTNYFHCNDSVRDHQFRGLWVGLLEWRRLVRESSIWSEYPFIIKPIKAIKALLRRMQINQPCWRATRWKSLT